jgi:tetratricopeptide (TPR) repeat protein
VKRAVVAAALVLAPAMAAAQPTEGDDDDEPPGGPADTGYIGRKLRLEIDDCRPVPDLPPKKIGALSYERYQRGSVLHVQGDYEAAVDELIGAYCLAPQVSGSMLVDIAQSYERMVQYEKAVAYFERYVLLLPEDTDERRAITTRIEVLRKLKSTVTVATEPRGASVVIANEAGPVATERDGERLSVVAGEYTLVIEKPGYEPVRQPLVVGIGQPYSFSFRLQPKSGELRVQTVPGDARIYIDDRFEGLGSFREPIEIGQHEVRVEAKGYLTRTENVEILADETAQIAISLARPPTSGKTQLVIAASVAGTIAGAAAVGGTTDDPTFGTLGGLGGLAIGGAGTYFLYDDIDLGSSNYIITTSLIGAIEGAGIGLLATDDPDAGWFGAMLGTGVGAGFAMATAGKLKYSIGDAALLNSGAAWGLVSGLWFRQVFHADTRVAAAMMLGGTNLGVVGGVLLGRQVEYSRRHVVFIDLAGLAGIATGLAVHSAYVGNAEDVMVERSEQQAHFALAGMAIGLGAGAFLTRNLDAPKLPRLQPQVAPAPGGARGFMLSVGGEL